MQLYSDCVELKANLWPCYNVLIGQKSKTFGLGTLVKEKKKEYNHILVS